MNYNLSHLEELENESINIIRETYAESSNPVVLYSVGKDSSVLGWLVKKAFAPAPIPMPFLHVDTTIKFKEMYDFREQFVKEIGAKLIVHTNKEGLKQIGNDFTCTKCSRIMKTEGLIQAITENKFDAALGGARRDEEKSRAKERVFSFRDKNMQWNPKAQRPEPWALYNTTHDLNETFRVFPISNWTELDIWLYIYQKNVPVVPLYFAKERDMIIRNGQYLLPGDVNQVQSGDVYERVWCRFRTLGCQLCTGAVLSTASSLSEVIEETITAINSERENRIVDKESGDSSMEDKKREGYF